MAKKLRVVLVKPTNLGDHIQPPLGLGFLANAIRDKHEVILVDCIKESIPVERTPRMIEALNPDVVGVQCYTFDFHNARSILSGVKQAMPNVPTLAGGPHISNAPLETMQSYGSALDYGFSSEAEKGIAQLMDIISNGGPGGNGALRDVNGLVWRDDNGQVVVNKTEFIQDLDVFGQPAWDLLKPETYPEAQHGAVFKKFPIAPIMTTRGCPYSCTFCSAPQISGRKLRHHSVEYIKDTISYLYRERGIREFHIVDDNFTMDGKYAKSLLYGIAELGLDISFATPNGIRMDALDDELLGLMKKVGFYCLSIAPESGSNETLKRMRKQTTVEKIKENADRIAKYNFEMAGFFILGFPGETVADVEQTIKFSRQLHLDRANYFCYLPLPGTESYNELVKSGEIKNVDWEHFFFTSAAYFPQAIGRERLLAMKRRAFLTFYLRPKPFFSLLRHIRSWRHFWFLLRRAYNWVVRF